MNKVLFPFCIISCLFVSCSSEQLSLQEQLSNAVFSYLNDNQIVYVCDTTDVDENITQCFSIESKAFANDDVQQKTSDSIKSLISKTLNATEKQETSAFEKMFKYSWSVDSVYCLLVNDLDANLTRGIQIEILLSAGGAEDITKYETKTSDSGETLIRDLYDNYIFSDKEINDVVDNFFTAKCKKKLMDAYEYELEPGEVAYALWELRSGVQDYDDSEVAKTGLKDIQSIGQNDYIVRFDDMGQERIVKIKLAQECGKWKIDDYQSKFRNEEQKALEQQGY